MGAPGTPAVVSAALHDHADKATEPVIGRMLSKAASSIVKQEAQDAKDNGLLSSMDDGASNLNTWFDACNATANNKVVSVDIQEQKDTGGRGLTFTVW